MLNLQPFQNFFTIFYIFGLNPFISFSNIKKKHSPIISALPRIINILVNVAITCNGAIFHRNLDYNVRLVYPIFVILSCVYICNYVAIVENLCHLNSARLILKNISFSINSLRTSLNIHFSYKTWKNSVKRKFILQMFVITIGSLVKYYFLNSWGLWRCSAWVFVSVLKSLNLIHFVFYVDFITIMLESLNSKISHMMIDRTVSWCEDESNGKLSIMHHIKSIHFKCWKISQHANSMFGWFIVVFIIEMIAVKTLESFRIFVVLSESCDHCLTRKYFHSD